MSHVYADLHFIERSTTEKSWHSGLSQTLLLIAAELVEDWRVVLDRVGIADLCLVTLWKWTLVILTLLNWTSGILTNRLESPKRTTSKEVIIPPLVLFIILSPLAFDSGLGWGLKHLRILIKVILKNLKKT